MTKQMTRNLTGSLAIIIIVIAVLSLAGCSKDKKDDEPKQEKEVSTIETKTAEELIGKYKSTTASISSANGTIEKDAEAYLKTTYVLDLRAEGAGHIVFGEDNSDITWTNNKDNISIQSEKNSYIIMKIEDNLVLEGIGDDHASILFERTGN